MKYLNMIMLAIIFSFMSSLVFAQGDKMDTILPSNAGLTAKAGTPESSTSVSQLDAGLASSVMPSQAGIGYKDGATKMGAYQIGIDDVLDINVIKPIPINSTMTVTSDGTITFPFIGSVQAKGKTLSAIQSEIQNRLADGYMDYPVVSVSLRIARSKKFTIFGEVIHPGGYLAEDGMSLLRAISLAGGLSVPGSTSLVRVLRPNKEGSGKSVIFESDLTEVLNATKNDIIIKAGDTVVVTIDKFFIYGEVNRPGSYPLEENMSLLNAITIAGGFIERSSTGVVKLLRRDGTEINFDIKAILSGEDHGLTVQSGDTLDVMVDKFYIYGQIARSGAYPVRENMDIMYAITAAGGFIESGSMGTIKLFRANPQKDEAGVLDFDIKSILGSPSQKAVVRAGDTIVVSLDKFFVTGQVKRPGAYLLEEHMSLLNAISSAGGLSGSSGMIELLRPKGKSGSAQKFETDFGSILNGTAPQVFIQPMDTIVVLANNFYVYGQVSRPGMYSLESKTTALTAISIAGGFSKFGSSSRVKVVRMNATTGRYEIIKVNINEAIAGNYKADVPLLPGDVVVVSEGIF